MELLPDDLASRMPALYATVWEADPVADVVKRAVIRIGKDPSPYGGTACGQVWRHLLGRRARVRRRASSTGGGRAWR